MLVPGTPPMDRHLHTPPAVPALRILSLGRIGVFEIITNLEQQPSHEEKNGLNSYLEYPNYLPQLGTCSTFPCYYQEDTCSLIHRLARICSSNRT